MAQIMRTKRGWPERRFTPVVTLHFAGFLAFFLRVFEPMGELTWLQVQ
jgi:hypothetical protein